MTSNDASADQAGSLQQWTAANPPTRKELAESYLLTLFVWMPPMLFVTGLHDEAWRLFVEAPTNIMIEATDITLQAAGAPSPELESSSGEKPTADDLSPGAFVLYAALQIGLAFVVLGAAVMMTVVGLVSVIAYAVAVVQFPRKSVRGTLAYYRAHRGETDV